MPWFGPRFTPRPLVATALALAPLLVAVTAGAECVPSTLDDPLRQGPSGQTLEASYHHLLDDLYVPGGATRRLDIGGIWHQVPPWFDSSTACESGNLKSWGEVTAPSFSDYVLNLDELSELAIVVSLGDDESRMREIDNTVQLLSPQSDHSGIPCWIARVNHGVGSIQCLSGDTASDATARLALSYYNAAANPHFSASARGDFLNRARALFDAHVLREYADLGCEISGVTGNQVCRWLAGGGNAAAGTIRMWIGYFQDVSQLLLAAYHDSHDALDLDYAEQVVDQFLMASEFDEASLSVGRRDFTWDLSGSEPAPANPEAPDYWPWMGNNAWDEADAPRALWVGHVLRSRELLIQGEPAPAFAALAEWVQQMIDTGTHTATTSCVQYGHDGTCVAVCGGAPKCNGLGYGLLTHHRPDLLPEKLDAMLSQYDWDNGRWGGTCFGIYDGVRPLKALAAALGLDSAAVGGVRPDGCRELDVARTGTGTGFVLSVDPGLDCGTDCSESWPLDTSVTLCATSYEGSTFAGWSGAGCEGGQVSLGVDTTCTASFDGTCTDPLDLAPEQISDSRRFAGCGHVTAGDGFEILANGEVELRAGGRVSLSSGFRVAMGGALRIVAGAE